MTRNAQQVVAAPTMMAAAVVKQPRRTQHDVVPAPIAGPHQALVRVEGCGVCGSSLPLWQGRSWFDYPLPPGAPGHEGWGVVEALGEEVNELNIGDRIAMLSQHAFAEWDVVDAEAAVLLPEELAGLPFPGEALGCALNIFHRSRIAVGTQVVVIGMGFLGALLTQLAVHEGAQVIAVSRREYALEIAQRCGASQVCRLDGAAEELRHRIPRGCEIVIEASGHQAALNLASAVVAEHGRIIIAGYHQDGLREVNMQVWNWKGIDVINAHERHRNTQVRGMREAVEAVLIGRIDPSPFYTHTFRLNQVDEAFAHLEQRPQGFLKALVVNA